MHRFRVGEGEVILFSTVQGLVSERERVLAALEETRPHVVALGQSPEASANLLLYVPSPDVDPFDDVMDHDLTYAAQLQEFGPVELPPADLVAAARWAQDAGVPCEGIDLPEDEYQTLFTKTVSTFGFLRYGRIQRRLSRRPPRAKDPRALALAWDAAFRKVKGIRLVEARREALMARRAAGLAREGGRRVFLLVDAPREEGIARLLASASG